jgi:hypothetical protein
MAGYWATHYSGRAGRMGKAASQQPARLICPFWDTAARDHRRSTASILPVLFATEDEAGKEKAEGSDYNIFQTRRGKINIHSV